MRKTPELNPDILRTQCKQISVRQKSVTKGSTRRFDLHLMYPIPQPAAARTLRLHQPSAVTHLFYAYVRKATDTEFNVFVLGRDLILVCDSLANQLRISLKICE
ncbi:hypothetical protein F511_46519 [Dorcoceras hygrometricum]|uniref:Uncharacterized protein n=1 Tax=Dorcoceras hygrometricum TaxID=472368 RepID=A0A2Z6ZTA2_9LAMI|nr:hypothetical protein F511_46519 [Dorcoceras hygrometricum]